MAGAAYWDTATRANRVWLKPLDKNVDDERQNAAWPMLIKLLHRDAAEQR